MFEIIAKSFAYAAELIVILDVPNVYLFLLVCSQRNSGSKNMRKRYGLSVSPWMVPLCIGLGFVLPKWFPVYIVVDCEYMFLIKATASTGYPRFFIIERSLAWSREPKAFLKSMYNMYIF